MAIDTAAKRYSMLNFGTIPIIPMFIPDGTIDGPDRAHLLNLYSGISLSSVSPPVFSGDLSDLNVTRGTTRTVDYSGNFSGATSYSISPAVESEWSFNTSTGVLDVVGDIEGNFGYYTITATNAGGDDASNSFSIAVRAASVGGSYDGRTIRSAEEYEKEIEEILLAERKEKLKEQKKLKKKEIKLEEKISLSEKQNKIRQTQTARLNLLIVSESLLIVEKDLIEIQRKRAVVGKKARIMRDDDEVIDMLMKNGWL